MKFKASQDHPLTQKGLSLEGLVAERLRRVYIRKWVSYKYLFRPGWTKIHLTKSYGETTASHGDTYTELLHLNPQVLSSGVITACEYRCRWSRVHQIAVQFLRFFAKYVQPLIIVHLSFSRLIKFMLHRILKCNARRRSGFPRFVSRLQFN